MSEKPKPAKQPKHKVDPHYGEMRPVTHVSRPNLLMRIGSRIYEKMTGK